MKKVIFEIIEINTLNGDIKRALASKDIQDILDFLQYDKKDNHDYGIWYYDKSLTLCDSIDNTERIELESINGLEDFLQDIIDNFNDLED